MKVKLLSIKLIIRWGSACVLMMLFLPNMFTCRAQTVKYMPQNELPRALSLEGKLYLLNMRGKQPFHLQQVYQLAYRTQLVEV